jgi:FkbM family methyltransferase
LRSILKPGDVFLDVGANIGFYTLQAARLVGPDGAVLAFEPLAATFAVLSQNVHELNHLANVQCVHSAVSNTTGEGVIYVGPRENSGASSLEYDWGKTGQAENIKLLRLDDCPALAPLAGRVSVIKIDAQGHELKVLEGARKTIAAAQPLVLIEVDEGMFQDAGASQDALYRFFADLGYKPHKILLSGKTTPIHAPEDGILVLFAHPRRYP